MYYSLPYRRGREKGEGLNETSPTFSIIAFLAIQLISFISIYMQDA